LRGSAVRAFARADLKADCGAAGIEGVNFDQTPDEIESTGIERAAGRGVFGASSMGIERESDMQSVLSALKGERHGDSDGQ
jgi:hypothetical protein